MGVRLNARSTLIGGGILLAAGLLVWQAVTAHGSPDPTARHLSPIAAVVDTGVLVFREGLEATLVLAAIVATLAHRQEGYATPVIRGAGLAFAATLATWFIVGAMISAVNASERDVR